MSPTSHFLMGNVQCMYSTTNIVEYNYKCAIRSINARMLRSYPSILQQINKLKQEKEFPMSAYADFRNMYATQPLTLNVNVCMYVWMIVCGLLLSGIYYPDDPSINDSTTSCGLLEGPPGESACAVGLKKRLVDIRGHSPPCSKVDTMKLPSAHTI